MDFVVVTKVAQPFQAHKVKVVQEMKTAKILFSVVNAQVGSWGAVLMVTVSLIEAVAVQAVAVVAQPFQA